MPLSSSQAYARDLVLTQPSTVGKDDALAIVWQDDALVAINKPAGLLVHRSPIDRHETRFAVQQLRDQLGCWVYPVHRLDKPTSGLLLFALEPALASVLAQQFESRTVHKSYWAVVRGHAPAFKDIDHPLRDEVDSKGRVCNDGEHREAQTYLRCMASWVLPMPVDRYPEARYSLVELQPRTGRFRQLRRHLKHIAHPIIGDTRYGKGTHNRFFRQQLGCNRLLLASVGLTFDHPITGASLSLVAKPEASFQSVLAALNQMGEQRGEVPEVPNGTPGLAT